MMSTRTKILICLALLSPVAVVVVAVVLLIPYLRAVLGSDSTIFVSVHFHLVPIAVLAALWVVLLTSAIMSFRRDKRTPGQN